MAKKQNGFQPMELESSVGDENGRQRLPPPLQELKERLLLLLLPPVVTRSLLLALLSLLLLVVVMFTNDNDKGPAFVPGTNTIDGPNSKTEFSSLPPPPLARREDDRAVQVGIPPADWDATLPRQSEESTVPLLDPPKMVPDPYGWLRDDERSDPEMLSHLHAENNYTERRLEHLTSLQETLYKELLQYMEETSHSFPVLDRSFYYYRRTIQGQPYPLHCRAPIPAAMDENSASKSSSTFDSGAYLGPYLKSWDGQKDTPILPGEFVYMDENVLAAGHKFFSTGSLAISPSQELLAYTADTTGNELYQLRVIRIDTGELVYEGGEEFVLTEQVEWGLDDDTLYYSKPDETQRTYQVWQRSLSLGKEELLYEERDLTYWVGFAMTKDKQYLLVETASSESSEFYYIALGEDGDSNTTTMTKKDTELECIAKRRPRVLYTVEHFQGQWLILSNLNDADGDMELFNAPVGSQDASSWTRVMDANENTPLLQGIALEELDVFRHHIVIEGRSLGILGLWILEINEQNPFLVSTVERVEFLEEPAHTAEMMSNEQYETNTILVNYVSMVTPQQRIQVNLYSPNAGDRLVVYETPTPGYNRNMYGCQRIDVLSRDGTTKIPVSLVYRSSTLDTRAKNGGTTVPIHLYAYGAYGSSMDDVFSYTRLPLLDRGMIFAVAHVRGGGEMGREWYTDGKLFNKHKTFDDFVDVGRYFVKHEWTTPELLSCEGRSAGGLTMGASVNQAPELFRAAILGVPFVDLVVTMMDASIPLTTGEWREWGNPNEQDYFDDMMAYSPMNNVKATTYPSMLLLAGLFDPRVAYWEPAKFTATLRHQTTPHPDRPICLKTDLTSGHFSASDRYKFLQGISFEYAFVLDQLGIV